jgi:thioesterase domain-containing protein
MALDYIEALRSVQPNGPYALAGWSLGGVAAFEMAQQLQRQRHDVSRLILLDSLAPGLMNQRLAHAGEASAKPDDDHLSEQDALARLAELCRTGTDEQISAAFAEVREAGFLPPEVALEDFQRWLQGCQTRVQQVLRYRPTPFNGRIILIKTFESEQKSELSNDLDPGFGWQELATEGLEIHTIKGSHYTVVLEPYVAELAAVIKRCLTL